MAQILNLIGVLCIFEIGFVQAWSATLDESSDTNRMWKIKKQSIYLADGNALRGPVHAFLPANFTFGNFALSKGIWAIVPNLDCETFHSSGFGNMFDNDEDTNVTAKPTTAAPPCNVTSSATFIFKPSAQLLSSVRVKYNSGGNATIRITGPEGRTPYEDNANHLGFAEWIDLQVPLDGNMMQLDATVYTKGSYVLIDKITVEFSEASTTSRPTKLTTTSTPTENPVTHEPFSGQGGLHDGTILTLMLTTALTLYMVT